MSKGGIDRRHPGMEVCSVEHAEDSHYGLASEEKRPVQGEIAIKGTRDGLRLTLEPETPFGELLNALAERLATSHGFFRGGELLVDTTRRRLRVSERTQLEALLAHYQMSIAPVVPPPAAQEAGSSGEHQAQTQELITGPGLLSAGETWLASEQGLGRLAGEQVTRDMRESDDTLFLRRTVRSGQAIHHHSNVVVLGDVNPGAEIVAGKDIIVWGVLRGMVHAGYPDNEGAMVCSLLLAPVQLRIAHLLSRPPEGLDVQPRPEVATIRGGQIVVEAWVNGRPPRK